MHDDEWTKNMYTCKYVIIFASIVSYEINSRLGSLCIKALLLVFLYKRANERVKRRTDGRKDGHRHPGKRLASSLYVQVFVLVFFTARNGGLCNDLKSFSHGSCYYRTTMSTVNLNWDARTQERADARTHGRTDARTRGQNDFVIIPFFLFQGQRCCLWLHPVTAPCMWNTTYVPLWNICIQALNTQKLQYNESKAVSCLPLQFQSDGRRKRAMQRFTVVSVVA